MNITFITEVLMFYNCETAPAKSIFNITSNTFQKSLLIKKNPEFISLNIKNWFCALY